MKTNICEESVTQLTRERELNEILFKLSSRFNSEGDFEGAMQRALAESATAIESEGAAIALREDDQWTVEYLYNLPQEFSGKSFPDEEHAAKASGARITVPLVVKGEKGGVLFLRDSSSGTGFDEIETKFAERAGVVLSAGLQMRSLARERERLREAILNDAAERELAEEALRESESKFRNIASAAQDAIILIETSGKVLFWNETATRMFGYSSEEMMGKNVHSFIMPERYREDFERGFAAFTLTGEGRFIGKTYEIEATRKDGTELPVELSLAGLKLKDKWNAIGIVRDISARKRSEEELKRTLAELERSNKEFEQFAYVASHDLQEPLRMVSSYVELLKRRYAGKLDEKADKYISFAVDGAKRMSNLINDLLTYSRVGTLGKELVPLSMDEMAKRAVANLKMAIKESEAVIEFKDLPVVNGDDTQLVQLLQNLMGNGIKFRKRDAQPRIRITAERRGKEWLFGVHDNGIGIEATHYERIFEIFQRLHSAEEYAGTGVGLAICKKIVERHGGRIWVDSHPGEGSTFFFTIPAAE